MLPKYVEGSNNIEHPVSLWQRHSFGEYKGFQEMGASFYAESQKPENEGKLPVVKYTGSESISIGKGVTSIPHFEFVYERQAQNLLYLIGIVSRHLTIKMMIFPSRMATPKNHILY